MTAHASQYLSEYMRAVISDGQPPMDIAEVAHIFCVLMFLAHSHVEDENCPLHVWHRHMFTKYCSLSTLNHAVLRLLTRLGFTLRVQDVELMNRLAFLRQSWSNRDAGH